jgi:hypothetical protein
VTIGLDAAGRLPAATARLRRRRRGRSHDRPPRPHAEVVALKATVTGSKTAISAAFHQPQPPKINNVRDAIMAAGEDDTKKLYESDVADDYL